MKENNEILSDGGGRERRAFLDLLLDGNEKGNQLRALMRTFATRLTLLCLRVSKRKERKLIVLPHHRHFPLASIIYPKRLENYSGYTRRYFPLLHKFPPRLDKISNIRSTDKEKASIPPHILTSDDWSSQGHDEICWALFMIAHHDDVRSEMMEIFVELLQRSVMKYSEH